MNPAPLSPDNPRLTAYALGELTGEEHAAIAAAVQADPTLAAEVRKIRLLAAELRSALAEEPLPATAPVVTGPVASSAPARAVQPATQPPRAKVIRGAFPYWLATAAAACFAAVMLWQSASPPAGAPQGGAARPQAAATVALAAPKTSQNDAPAQPADGIDALKYQTVPATAPATNPAPAGGSDQNAVREKTVPSPGAPVVFDSTVATATPAPLTPAATPPPAAGSSFSAAAKGGGAMLADSTLGGPPPNSAAQPAGTLTLNGANSYTGSSTVSGAPGYAFGGGAGGSRGGRGGRGGGGGGAGGGGGRAPVQRVTTTVETYAPAAVLLDASEETDVIYRYPSLPREVIVMRRRPPPAFHPAGGESYAHLLDNAFTDPVQTPLSTFALDVDTASYANVRRFLTNGRLPPPDAVRIEELINYFPAHDALPTAASPDRAAVRTAPAPFAVGLETAQAPWQPTHRLVRVVLKARDVPASERGPANLVFLLDVSGSMNEPNKLPLVKESMRLLLGRLRPDDRVAIVTYAGESGLALPSTPVANRNVILDAIDGLNASGGTNGGAGIQLAYQVAQANFNREGINRIIQCTDGDFNVGVTSRADLIRLIEEHAQSGVSLTILGFGMGNLKDATLEALADKGHGNYGYIDTRREAEKLFVEQLSGTLVTVAKDVKVQVEFNPARVAAYRLIGYEDRLLQAQDFNNDRVTAGDVGAGHTVTALYEIVPVGADYGYTPAPGTDPSRYTEPVTPDRADAARSATGANSNELLTVKIRFKPPTSDESQRLEFPLVDRGTQFAATSTDFQFAAAVAGFGMVLRDSPYRGSATMNDVLAWASRAVGDDPGGYRAEFTDLVRRARDLRRETPVNSDEPPASPSGGSVDPLRY